MTALNSNTKSKERPKLFRALGNSNPPERIFIEDDVYQRIKIIKHDSWAATALYESNDQIPVHKVVCKFNRTQPIGLLPMRWLGRKLAQREYQMYHTLADLPGIAKGYLQITSDGTPLSNACAHDFIEGHPLRWHDVVKDDFFDKLDSCLIEMHRRNIAYVDMNKAENVIVNTNGDPCLIDFQISVHWNSFWLRIPLRILQRSDLYHSFKLRSRYRPDLVGSDQENKSRIPWWIRAHRSVATPFRKMRRRLLVALGIRKGEGMCQSEVFVEEALNAVGSDQTPEKPILRLYQLLRSDPYSKRFDSVQPYRNQILIDLFDGAVLHTADRNLANKTRLGSEHNIVVDLLMSKTLFLKSNNWDQQWIEGKIHAIEQSIISSDSQPQQDNNRNQAA